MAAFKQDLKLFLHVVIFLRPSYAYESVYLSLIILVSQQYCYVPVVCPSGVQKVVRRLSSLFAAKLDIDQFLL
jgi:hypothetical protein